MDLETKLVEGNLKITDQVASEQADETSGFDFVNPGEQEDEGGTEAQMSALSPQPSPSGRGTEGEGEAANVAPETPTAPDLAAETVRIREDLRREFQSQKDREIHRERQKWEEEHRAQEFQRSLEDLPDAEVARQVRDQQRERIAAAKARTEAMSTIYAEVGKAMQTVPEFGELEGADWDNLLRQGSFGEFLAAVVDRGVKRRFGEEVEKRATELAEAKFRERMAAIRPGETSPDLTPAAGPSPTFENLESRYLAGEVSLADYTDARRRRGLEVY